MVTGKEVASVKGHFGPVHSLDVHPSGRSFVSVSEDGHARVHELDEEYFTSEFD
jgi:translation initiation factor 3 subunit I